jgi:hypothetical protein
VGRYLTPDPYRASGGPAAPQTWNRYAYVEGDPVNFNDPEGLWVLGSEKRPEQMRCAVGGTVFYGDICDFYLQVARFNQPSQVEREPEPGDVGWGARKDRCHERNLESLRRFEIEPVNPQFGSYGGIRWQVPETEAATLRAQLEASEQWAHSTWSGEFHREEVGAGPGDTVHDYRSYKTASMRRSVQLTFGPGIGGFVWIYSDTDRWNPLQDGVGVFGHFFGEVVPGVFGKNRSCDGIPGT